MKQGLLSYSSAIAVLLLATPLAAWADRNPDFDDDAKPILRMQPGLLEFVEASFQVKDTGIAKIPGNDDRHAQPPYIFQAKPRGYGGAYYITLLIQPGSPGHVLKVVDPTKAHGGTPPRSAQYDDQVPPMSQQQPPSVAVNQAPVVQQKAPVSNTTAQQPTAQAPTADTPSGPISANGQPVPLPPAPSSTPSLEPPPDPAPATSR